MIRRVKYEIYKDNFKKLNSAIRHIKRRANWIDLIQKHGNMY